MGIKKAFNRGIERGLKDYEKSARDENIKALAKIKVILEFQNRKDYHIDFELEETIEEIEAVLDKKNNHIETFKSDRRLNTIKNLIKESYEKMGRTGITNDGNALSILINKLNKYCETVEIPSNYLAIARLRYEKSD